MTPSIHYFHRRAPKAASAADAVTIAHQLGLIEWRRQHPKHYTLKLVGRRVATTEELLAAIALRKDKFQSAAFALFERLKAV
jgi:hypothetical protein